MKIKIRRGGFASLQRKLWIHRDVTEMVPCLLSESNQDITQRNTTTN